ncbi:Protein CBG24795 [Caenorhabditis briggsae]|uniref:Protein CBG24795 n=2 Tax=Caenorhabditis briggsae TaxID=6238 RepID=A8WLI1_CAEBR|nr:Protein CBG24795 [Caenorhabditis briggsae]CAP21326.1 Protein CBG24795 [Caenorhabditis briggsae]
MPSVYEYLTDQQKNNIMSICVKIDSDHIMLILGLQSPYGETNYYFSYETFGSNTTIVMFDKEHLDPIQHNFVDVVLEDLEMMMVHRKTVLSYININCILATVDDRARICERLQMSLKLRSAAFPVKVAAFSGTTIAQAASFTRLLDRAKLLNVLLTQIVDPENFERFLNEFKSVKAFNFDKHISISFSNQMLQTTDLDKPDNQSMHEMVARKVLENRLPMQFILRQLQCFDIERLRKVNRGIRNCIDLIRPNPHIEKCAFTFSNGMWLRLNTHTELKNNESKHVEYRSDGVDIYIQGVVFPKTNYMDLCLHDIETILRNQSERIEELLILYKVDIKNDTVIIMDDLSERIGKLLEGRESTLKTKKFSMGSDSQKKIMNILPAIDENSLTTIELLNLLNTNFKTVTEEFRFEVDQISQTKQWKSAEQLISKHLTIITPIQEMNVLHFADLEILVEALSSEDVAYLKTNLLKSSSFQKFKISFLESTVDESLHTLIGQPYRIVSDSNKVWYFRIPNTDCYIHVVLNTHDVDNKNPKVIRFKRVAKEDTPFN